MSPAAKKGTKKSMPKRADGIESVRASRAGHTFHERWAARRALQLVFPNDNLFAIAVEGISSTETAKPGARAEEVADLVLYYGRGDSFQTCERLETIQFKYKLRDEEVTASYLKKTLEKFADTILGYEKDFSTSEVDRKLSFVFVTNAKFNENLAAAIESLLVGTTPKERGARDQLRYLKKCCSSRGLLDANRLFSRIVFRAGEKGLAAQDNALKRTLTDWSPGADSEARVRLHDLQDLVLKKAGPSGQNKNLIRREDVLDALNCEPEDLFPADTRFIDIGSVVERHELSTVAELLKTTTSPVFVHAEGGVGKTVFVQSLAARMASEFETVVFDCFGGGSYRSDNYSRHLPKIGLVQIVNELASRTLCDPMLPGGGDARQIIKAARRRLEQAAKAIRTQSKKLGVLLIVDASDNAQLEADYRQEDAFPKLLLSAVVEDPIDGVRLLLTARTHRKNQVIDRATVREIELGPFSDLEAREFLQARKPDAANLEVRAALARSGRNARVLDYLVQTWETNVAGETSNAPISVPEIIAQRCAKILSDLHIAGWPDSEVVEFFVALSLLPPPIPLNELASALGWSVAQVNTAASDLAPMLEIASHGAIFRDEPTETYVRETYAERPEAQRTIADRLLSSQATSIYAAEALPHFLVVIKDSDRAFALADSASFPVAVQSDFGRRRLTLARLRAAFRLAVAGEQFDRVLGLSMRLAQAATAVMRGDEFIRSSPALAVVLGDADSYRRLFADRSGWRGARSARLAVAHRFAGDIEEAQIQSESTTRWINWHVAQPRDAQDLNRAGPEVEDYTSVLFQHVAEKEFASVDRNLVRWNFRFSLAVSKKLLELSALFDQVNGTNVLADFVSFVSSERCLSQALKLRLLSYPRHLTKHKVKALAKAVEASAHATDEEPQSFDAKRKNETVILHAALTTLIYGSRPAAKAVIRQVPISRPTAYYYGERYGTTEIWPSILLAGVRSWSAGRRLAYHDLLPEEVKISKQAKAIANSNELKTFLKGQLKSAAGGGRRRGNGTNETRFNSRECEDICKGIEIALGLTAAIQEAVLSRNGISGEVVTGFLGEWRKYLREGVHWNAETAADSLARSVGIGCVNVLLNHADEISDEHVRTLIGLVSAGRFSIGQKVHILAQLARRSAAHESIGIFARHIADQVREDSNISLRGSSYADLAGSLVPMSLEEARDYYRKGLAQLDQLGGESYDQIYSLLQFASAQTGGFLKPEHSQRLMNLCQTIFAEEPSKFGWTMFARAAAKSIGFPAIAKLVRWNDQDVAELSYGLPQLACFLADSRDLDPRRAAVILMICKDHGWWDWRSGDAVAGLMKLSDPADQKRIFFTILEKLQTENPLGAWPSLWESYLRAANLFPNSVATAERDAIEELRAVAQRAQDESNSRNSSSSLDVLSVRTLTLSDAEIDDAIATLVSGCNPPMAHSIDAALATISADDRLRYEARQKFIEGLCNSCQYSQRLDFMFSVCEAGELSFSQSVDILAGRFTAWSGSSMHIVSKAKAIVERLLEFKSSELFDTPHSNIVHGIHQLSELCGDKRFVLQLVLCKIVADEVSLDGNEWLQLATALCGVASAQASFDSLELLLSGPASRIADEIGEGPYKPDLAVRDGEAKFFADLLWHLLGDEDAYVRWTVARSVSKLCELGLHEDLSLLLDNFDQREVTAFVSADRKLSFQNSQQWLLMGLARAAPYYGKGMEYLRDRLLLLARRNDMHVINCLHIARCLRHISREGDHGVEANALFDQVNRPPCGIVVNDDYPPAVKPTSGFHFDYEFTKHEISDLARLFSVAEGTITDAIAAEIRLRWPEASSMNYFPGRERYEYDRNNRYETYREHIQRHAFLNAATSLSKTRPVVVRGYESEDDSSWLEWRDRHDVTFDDGSWLSDRKDAVPPQARENLLGMTKGRHEALQSQQTVMRKLGLVDAPADSLFPIYGRWSSPDDVTVSISSALSDRTGAIGRCAAFAKHPSHDLWLPEFWDGGYYDQRFRQESVFAPLVWAPETHSLGIDEGDEFAAQGPAGRPRLGIVLTKTLRLIDDSSRGCWRAADGSLALSSQVWGNWKAEYSGYRNARHHDDGEILWASPEWLGKTLSALGKRLVFTVTLWKYRSSRDQFEPHGVKAVWVGLRLDDGTLRFWRATKASRLEY